MFRVHLRAFELNDFKLIHEWRQDPNISNNFGGIKMFSSTENEKEWISNKIFDKRNVNCAICLNETNEMIGCIFLNDIDMHNKTGHCPSFIGNTQHLGKGYASEARLLILRYAFYERGLNRIWARVITDNIPSIKMVEKCGYKKEGELKQSIFKNGELKNEYIYAVLKEDFDKIWQEKYENSI